MSASTARALSIALVGAIAAVLFFTQGLLVWAGFIAWANLIEAGGDGAALKRTIAGNLVGALLGWVALLLILYIVVPSDGYLWMPRTGAAIAVTLLALVLATRSAALSHLPVLLCGYAAVLGASTRFVDNVTGTQRFTGMHLYNPFVEVAISMVAGALAGYLATRLAGQLAKS